MNKYNFNDKFFALMENSDKGQVTSETTFQFKQEDQLVTADYNGGSIKYGKIIALLNGDQLDMLYQCVTTENIMKAGKAIANIHLNNKGKIQLKLNWEWLGDKKEKGISEYLEL